MRKVSVVIPNLNGKEYLRGCLQSLRDQTSRDFNVIVIDNGSSDGSADMAAEEFPEVVLRRFSRNTGFCHAVNAGISLTDAPYVLLLNNDTVCDPRFVERLTAGIERHPKAFSAQSCMLMMQSPELVDDAGDFYCALGWAFARGKGKKASLFDREKKIFASCGGAAIYRRELLLSLGGFDDAHFAYLEDIDLGYRARLAGLENWYIPDARVLHAGSAASGSRYNSFKVKHTSRNNIYLLRKNMPWPQVAVNLPLLLAGWLVKAVFFTRKGLARDYLSGSRAGFALPLPEKSPVRRRIGPRSYLVVQAELWANVVRRFFA